jgi:hypothetical protein
LFVITTDSTTYQATGLTPGWNYGFAVRAMNIVGKGDLSTIAIIMSATVADPPQTPILVFQS